MCEGIKAKRVEVNFAGGIITSDAGLVLLRQAEQKTKLLDALASSMIDQRNSSYTKHSIEEIITQRVFGIACGYEDGNDHKELRKDAMFKIASNKGVEGEDLASPSTICRLENSVKREDLIQMSKVMVEQFIKSFKKPPKSLVLDFDATDDIVHGNQEGKFFHGYYDNYCYLPLYVFCGRRLLVSYLRAANKDAAYHAWAILKLLVRRFREEWPEIRIIMRADSGFCRHRMLRWCERENVYYIIGIARNNRLLKVSEKVIKRSVELFKKTNQKARIFGETRYAAKSWRKERRVIIKAEQLIQGENIRYVVTNLNNKDTKYLYDKIYCQRGDMENRIKEHQLELFGDRTSCHKFLSNQFRLLLASAAYILLEYIRRIGLKGTKLAKAQCGTIRLKLIKIGAIILENTRKILIQMSEHFVYRNIFELVARRLI